MEIAYVNEPPQDPNDPLYEVDHIRMYVDARYAMQIRQLLHLWRYECELPPDVIELRRFREKEKEKEQHSEQGKDTGMAVDMEDDSPGRKRKREREDADEHGKGKQKATKRDDIASFRMFIGAKLVLLDNTNHAMLVC